MTAGQLVRAADISLYGAKRQPASRQPAMTGYLQVA
jgi:hypothetical protein